MTAQWRMALFARGQRWMGPEQVVAEVGIGVPCIVIESKLHQCLCGEVAEAPVSA